jgi:hypothetical protein
VRDGDDLPEKTPHLLTDQLATATQEILLTMTPSAPSVLQEGEPELCEALADAMQNGADISLLVHPDCALGDKGPIDCRPAVREWSTDGCVSG